jgi:hypothetical protein
MLANNCQQKNRLLFDQTENAKNLDKISGIATDAIGEIRM